MRLYAKHNINGDMLKKYRRYVTWPHPNHGVRRLPYHQGRRSLVPPAESTHPPLSRPDGSVLHKNKIPRGTTAQELVPHDVRTRTELHHQPDQPALPRAIATAGDSKRRGKGA